MECVCFSPPLEDQGRSFRAEKKSDGEVVEKKGKSSCPAKRARGGPWRCGICGNTGHNVRIYKIDIKNNIEKNSD